jgi:hypothetical protein
MDFECSVFNGVYVTNDVSEDYLAKLEARRNDANKRKKEREAGLFGDIDEDEGQLALHSNG